MSVVDENMHSLVERDVNYVAGSVKCIRCGTNYNSKGRGSGGGGESPERWLRYVNNRTNVQNHNRGYHSTIVTGPTQISGPTDLYRKDDDIEIHNGVTPEQSLSADQLHGLSEADYSRREAEEYLAVIRRQGGLKPLSRQSQPMQTKPNPYMNSGTYVFFHIKFKLHTHVLTLMYVCICNCAFAIMRVSLRSFN